MSLISFHIRYALAACLLAGLVDGAALADTAQELTGAQLDPAFQLVEQAVAKQEIPGALLLVAHHGKIVREQAYGVSDIEGGVPFRTNTICWRCV